MKKSNLMTNIIKDLDFCSSYWTILYGSFVEGKFVSKRSDVDVAVITRIKDKDSNSKLWLSILEKITPRYDIKIFELLPLFLKIEIIQSYYVLFGDPLEISEYFYHYRSIWKEMAGRHKSNQYVDIQEKINMLENQKRIS